MNEPTALRALADALDNLQRAEQTTTGSALVAATHYRGQDWKLRKAREIDEARNRVDECRAQLAKAQGRA